jgi:hypothetical protein
MLFVFVEKVTGGSKHPAPVAPAVPQSLATEHGQGSH